jgi:hypothetical protein
MAQRFPGPVPTQGPGGPPQQRYPPPQNPGMRQYASQTFPVSSGWEDGATGVLLFCFAAKDWV